MDSSANTPGNKPDLSRLTIQRDQTAKVGGNARFIGTKYFYLLLAFVIVLIILFFIFGRAKENNQSLTSQNQPVKQSAQLSSPSTGPNSANQKYSGPSVLNATGYVVAQRQAAVASKATGRLIELRVEEGDLVKKDDIIAVIDNADLKAVVAQQEAYLKSLNAQLGAAKAELNDAQVQFKRMQTLRSDKVSSQSEFDVAESRFKKAQAGVEAAEANIALANAQLEKAKVDLSYSYIVAPFDGTVLTKTADVGEIVAPMGSSSNSRAAVVTIADMQSLEVEADVSEANLSKIRVGQKCEITLDSLPERVYHGQINKIVPTVDRAKATVLTKIKFTDLDDKVIPEMSAKVRFLLN